jgi:hypothetical protein
MSQKSILHQEWVSGGYIFERSVSHPLLIGKGRAYFTYQGPGRYHYREQGCFGDQEFYQTRIFHLKEDVLQIYKQDNSLLHQFDLKGEGPFIHRHQCGQDLYTLTLFVPDSAHFTTYYNVLGPKKNYQIHTVYNRIQ